MARAYGRRVETGVLADSVMLTSGTTTAVVAGHPDVPGLDQVAEARKLVDDIDRGGVEAGRALARPVLLYFIPGDVLTAAVLELADGRLTAGAGAAQLGTAALGIFVTVTLMPRRFLFDQAHHWQR